jgi:hypothetical protein
MRLYEILSNGNDLSNIISILKKDCAPFIEVLKKNHGKPLFRGSDSGKPDNGQIKLISPRVNRKPKDTPNDIHNFMNRQFEAKFGFPYRDGIFVTGVQRTAAFYGSVCVVFPIGELKYIWSDLVDDLLYVIERIYSHEDFDDTDTVNQNPQLAQEFIDLVDSYKSDNLDRAISTGHEIILANNCYMINLKDYNAILHGVLK